MTEKNLKQNFGYRVQQLRRLKGLTQEELAEAIDRSVDTISNIERGFSSTRIETAANIAKILGVTLSDLYDFESVSKNKYKEYNKEIDRLVGLVMKCPAHRLPILAKLIELAATLSFDGQKQD